MDAEAKKKYKKYSRSADQRNGAIGEQSNSNSFRQNTFASATGHQANIRQSFASNYSPSSSFSFVQHFSQRPPSIGQVRSYRQSLPAVEAGQFKEDGEHLSRRTNYQSHIATGGVNVSEFFQVDEHVRIEHFATESQPNRAKIKDLVKRWRTWNVTQSGKKYMAKKESHTDAKGVEFTLMTYNVLSQNLISQHGQLYTHCSKLSLDWVHRFQQLSREIKQCSPDVVCLQEVNKNHFEQDFTPFFTSIGYSGLYKKRTGDKLDGCALFYNTSKFTLDKFVKLDFYQTNVSSLLDRDNVAIIVRLRPVSGSPDNHLVIGTTHLLFNPKRGDIKLAQLRYLLAELGKIAKTEAGGQYPVLLCGDMNTEPESPVYRFLKNGKMNPINLRTGDLSGQQDGRNRGELVNANDLKMAGINMNSCYGEKSTENSSVITHPFNFDSVYPTHNSKTQEAFVSTDHQKASALVDYIFYAKSQQLNLIGYQRLLTSRQLQAIGSLPNTYLGSDHLSLTAKFVLSPLSITANGNN
ncbi:Protein angel -like protein 2 [Halotydeus destructor]|nr:Protein angel -like protein 2 [Halotydeus destructor]